MRAPRDICRLRLFAGVVLLFGFSFAEPAVGTTYGQCRESGRRPFSHLDVNGVIALLNASELQFFGGGDFDVPRYEVPAGSGRQSLFIANLMVGGKIDGETKVIQATYGGETLPGPLDENGAPLDDCVRFDRVFKVSLRDIANFETSGQTTRDLVEWPWQAGAPVRDGDGNPDNYDLVAGDRPAIEGHQMLWWVMNDKAVTPSQYNSTIGLEISVSAFAVASEDPALDYATFYRYKLTHWGEAPLVDAYFGQLVDPDVGGYNDDLVGSDTALGLAFAYNGDDFDEGSGRAFPGYGDRPPAIGVVVVEGVASDNDGLDNDRDGLVDETGERIPMSKFVVHSGGATATGNPSSDEDFYRYLQGIWRDDVPITYGGQGRGWTSIPVDFMYPGNPPDYWSMENSYNVAGSGSTPSDHVFLWSTGPFSLEVGESKELVIAYLWAQGEDRYDSIRRLKEAVPRLRGHWKDGFQIPIPDAPTVVPELYAPDNGSTGQPTNLRLSWRKQPGRERHEVQISRSSDFLAVVDSAFTASTSTDLEVANDATYFWRVRGVNAGGHGPWSKTWSFSTGSVEQIAPGALAIDGQGTWAFIQVEGAEGENDGCNPEAQSTYGCAEVGGNAVYGSFNGARTWILFQNGVGPEGSLGRFAPRDFEVRFTLKGSYAFQAETSGRVLHVPFEVWDIGDVGPFGTNDRADDVQLIPGLYSDNGGECFFGFGEVRDDPFGLGWPVTDRVYAYYPAVGTTYGDWREAVEPLVAADPDGCPIPTGSNSVSGLVDIDRMPLQRLIFMMDPEAENYRPEGVPMGNIIRFLTTKPTRPILSAPVDQAAFLHGTLPDGLSLWWQLPSGVATSRVQITQTAPVHKVVVDSVVSGYTFKFLDPPLGLYTWRVGYSTDTEFWSDPAMFHVFSIASAESELAGIPTVLTLRQPYPNPTSALAHFDVGLPQTGRVTLTAYDLLGRRVAYIADEPMTPGWTTVDWNTDMVSNGVYVVRLESGAAAVSKKVVVVK